MNPTKTSKTFQQIFYLALLMIISPGCKSTKEAESRESSTAENARKEAHSDPKHSQDSSAPSGISSTREIEDPSSEATVRLIILADSVRSLADFENLAAQLERENLSESQRAMLIRQGLGALSSSGMLKDALLIASELAGPGQNRSSLIGHIFSYARDSPQALLEIADSLEFEDDRKIGRGRVSSALATASIGEIREFVRLHGDDDELMLVAGRGLSERFSSFENLDESRFMGLDSLIADHLHHPKFIEGLLNYPSRALAEHLWDPLTSGPKHESWDQFGAQFLMIATRRDPHDTLERLMNWDSSSGSDVAVVVDHWLQMDSNDASVSISGNSALKERPELFDPAAGRIARFALQHGEFETANSWIDLISDEELAAGLREATRNP